MNQLHRARVFYLVLCIAFGLCIVGTMDLEANTRNPPPAQTASEAKPATPASVQDDARYVFLEAGNVAKPRPADSNSGPTQ